MLISIDEDGLRSIPVRAFQMKRQSLRSAINPALRQDRMTTAVLGSLGVCPGMI